MVKEIILLVIPLIFLILTSITDVRERKIENRLLFVFLIIGIILSIYNKIVIPNLVLVIILLFIGYFRIIPMGDLKLWIVLTLITSYKISLIVISIGAILTIVYALLSRTSKYKYKLEDIVFMVKNRVLLTKNTKKYPFALFVLIGYIIYQILVLLKIM